MPFYILKDGSEVLIDAVDFPEPSPSLLRTNPYASTDIRYKKYLNLMKARYYKGLYKSAREALDRKDFEERVGDLHDFLRDTDTSWNQYLRERGLPTDKPKNPIGRPKMEDHLKKVNPRVKRSTKMKSLLLEKGISVNTEGELFLEGNSVPYEDTKFLVNGRISINGNTISTHKFLETYY